MYLIWIVSLFCPWHSLMEYFLWKYPSFSWLSSYEHGNVPLKQGIINTPMLSSIFPYLKLNGISTLRLWKQLHLVNSQTPHCKMWPCSWDVNPTFQKIGQHKTSNIYRFYLCNTQNIYVLTSHCCFYTLTNIFHNI